MTNQCAHGYEDGKCTTPWCEYSEALEASRHKAAFVAERTRAERDEDEAKCRVDAAWNAALEKAAEETEVMGRQWGIMRSMDMTSHARAATKVAVAIRTLKREVKT